jgi:type IV secretory pathway VirB10-like protein
MTDPNSLPPAAEPGTVPAQPEAPAGIKKSMPVIVGISAVILVIGLANVTNIVGGKGKEPSKSALPMKPLAPNATQVNSFEAQQRQQAQHDAVERERQAQLAAQAAQLQEEQGIPGPEGATASPMTEAQRRAIYGDSPNAPKNTSNVTQAQAEAKQRKLAREKQHQDALNSDTVAIDFATSGGGASKVLATSAAAPQTEAAEDLEPKAASADAGNGSQSRSDSMTNPIRNVSASQPRKDVMGNYDFDGYQGRLYRVFEGTVFEGIVTNHVDGSLAGPMIVMLTTDYYSHDHQELLLPQGTRLIGNVQSVNSGGQRKLLVVFNRAVCPDGFSLDLNKFMGLDPLGTSGLATNVNNHYLSSFAAAAAIGGIGGLAQAGNSGSILDSSTQIRNGISAQTAAESEQILNKFLNRLPTITVKEGSRARIYINQDLLIPSYAEHRVDPTL